MSERRVNEFKSSAYFDDAALPAAPDRRDSPAQAHSELIVRLEQALAWMRSTTGPRHSDAVADAITILLQPLPTHGATAQEPLTKNMIYEALWKSQANRRERYWSPAEAATAVWQLVARLTQELKDGNYDDHKPK